MVELLSLIILLQKVLLLLPAAGTLNLSIMLHEIEGLLWDDITLEVLCLDFNSTNELVTELDSLVKELS